MSAVALEGRLLVAHERWTDLEKTVDRNWEAFFKRAGVYLRLWLLGIPLIAFGGTVPAARPMIAPVLLVAGIAMLVSLVRWRGASRRTSTRLNYAVTSAHRNYTVAHRLLTRTVSLRGLMTRRATRRARGTSRRRRSQASRSSARSGDGGSDDEGPSRPPLSLGSGAMA